MMRRVAGPSGMARSQSPVQNAAATPQKVRAGDLSSSAARASTDTLPRTSMAAKVPSPSPSPSPSVHSVSPFRNEGSMRAASDRRTGPLLAAVSPGPASGGSVPG